MYGIEFKTFFFFLPTDILYWNGMVMCGCVCCFSFCSFTREWTAVKSPRWNDNPLRRQRYHWGPSRSWSILGSRQHHIIQRYHSYYVRLSHICVILLLYILFSISFWLFVFFSIIIIIVITWKTLLLFIYLLLFCCNLRPKFIYAFWPWQILCKHYRCAYRIYYRIVIL